MIRVKKKGFTTPTEWVDREFYLLLFPLVLVQEKISQL